MSPIPFDQLNQMNWQVPPRFEEPLKQHTSISVGGIADVLVTVSNLDELRQILTLISDHQAAWYILGKGTNTLAPDEGFRGVVIAMNGDFSSVTTNAHRLEVGAAVSNRRLADKAREGCLSGVEFLKSIPGSMGGAIMMNAGAFGERIADIVEWVEYCSVDGSIHRLSKGDLEFDYRHSYFSDKRLVIVKVSLILRSGNIDQISAKEKKLSDYRREHHPKDRKTWGSVFLNPSGQSAGGLIESCGLKGKGFGGAKISEKHGNFIINTGNATFEDLMKTIDMARKAVQDQYGISLRTEGKIMDDGVDEALSRRKLKY